MAPILRPGTGPSGDTPRVHPRDRIYAVGDIHGRHDLLVAMLALVREDARRCRDHRVPRLVFLGDYIDRGDDSAQVLETLSGAISAADPRTLCLMGNHEAALLSFLDDPVRGRAWLEFGAAQTLASFGLGLSGPTDDPERLRRLRDGLLAALGPTVDVLRGMPLHCRSGDVVFVHAGLAPGGQARFTDADTMLWGDPGFLTPSPVPGLRVVHGHYDSLEPAVFSGRVCIDTGAYHSGRLTALRLDDGEALLSVTGS